MNTLYLDVASYRWHPYLVSLLVSSTPNTNFRYVMAATDRDRDVYILTLYFLFVMYMTSSYNFTYLQINIFVADHVLKVLM